MGKKQHKAKNADLILEEIAEQLTFNRELIKQIPRSYRGELEQGTEAKLAEGTIYPVWRGFLRAYMARWGGLPANADAKTQQTFEDFGDLELEFQQWWSVHGRNLFTERGQLPVVTVEEIDADWVGGEFPKYVTVRLPLTIPKDAILKQLNEILKRCHLGGRLYRHQFSTARYKLHPRSKYVRRNFERMLRVWELVMEHREGKAEADQMPWWEIGALAGLAPGVDPNRDKGTRRKDSARRHLAKLASELFGQAEAIMHNAVRGVFPKDCVENPDGVK